MKLVTLSLLLLTVLGMAAEPVVAPGSLPTPSPAQLAWQQAEFGVILHFDPRLFNGTGRYQSLQPACRLPLKDPAAYAAKFNPTKLDTDQWVLTARNTASGGRYARLLRALRRGRQLGLGTSSSLPDRNGARPREVNLPFQKCYTAFLYYMPFLEAKPASADKR